jgi:hypothetical protein
VGLPHVVCIHVSYCYARIPETEYLQRRQMYFTFLGLGKSKSLAPASGEGPILHRYEVRQSKSARLGL